MAFIIVLILVGIVLLLAEVLLIPGIGIAGILGLLSLGGSCFYTFYEFGNIPGTIVTVINVILVVGLLAYVLRAKTWKKLSLETKIDSTVAYFDESRIAVGDRGKALTRLGPMGTVKLGDITCEAKSLEGIIDPGTEVEVVLIEDRKIYVKPAEDDF